MPDRLAGRTALVSGSTSGIGRAIALAMAAEGAFVVVTGRSAERGAAVLAEVEAQGGVGLFVAADLGGGKAAVDSMLATVAETGRTIDILVNNASFNLVAPMWTAETSEADIDMILAGSLKGPFLLTAGCIPPMVERGGGVIINIGSVMAMIGKPGGAIYTAVKAAMHGLTLAWTAEFGPSGIRVNTIAPGPTLTDAVREVEDQLAFQLPLTPSRAFSTPEQIAAAAVFLASDDATNIHGITLPIDGGYVAI